MKRINGAEILIRSLIAQGVRTAFGYPGSMVLHVFDKLYKYKNKLRFIMTAGEQGAAHAADGYARATGDVGVVIATSGPGATNLVTGIATAHLDSVPLVIITGNVPLSQIGRDSFQEVDITGVTLPLVKHSYFVKDVSALQSIVDEAFSIARSGRPGTVLIDIPINIQTALLPEPSFAPVCAQIGTTEPDEEILAKAVHMIDQSLRPFIYAGGGVVSAGASKELMALSRQLLAPVGLSMTGLSAIPSDYSLNLGMTGLFGTDRARAAIGESDLIIGLGVRFSNRAVGERGELLEDKCVLHVDIDPAELNKNVPASLAVAADVKTFLERINTRVKKRGTCMFNLPPVLTDESYPARIIKSVSGYLKPSDIVVTDVGKHQIWVARALNIARPRSLLMSAGLGTMGFGLGASIGACLSGQGRVVLFTGDGSFLMSANELSTAVSLELNLTVIVMNNASLGLVRQWQQEHFEGRSMSTVLNHNTDFVKLAEAYGAAGFRADTPESLDSVLERAFLHKGVSLVDCIIGIDEKV